MFLDTTNIIATNATTNIVNCQLTYNIEQNTAIIETLDDISCGILLEIISFKVSASFV